MVAESSIAFAPQPLARPRFDLKDHCARINETYRLAAETARNVISHALECGRLLNEVKAGLPYGQWGSWLEANFEGSQRTAADYMALAEAFKADASLQQRAAKVSSLREALRLIRPVLPSEPASPGTPVSFRFRDITLTRVERLAACRGRSQTVVIEDAIEAFEELWDERQAGTEVVLRRPDGSEKLWGRL